MTARPDIEGVLDGFLVEGPDKVADHALMRALDEIDQTQQRRDLLAPWRRSLMITFPRLAAAALVAVIAIGGAVYVLGSHPTVGVPAVPTPTAAASPTTAAVVSTPHVGMDTDTAKWTQFTGSRYGYSVSWPNTAVWTHSSATEDWAGQTSYDMWASNADAPWVDKFYDQATQLTMTAVATTIPVGTTEEAFIDAYLKPGKTAPTSCPERASAMAPIVIDGHAARETTRCGDQAAFVAVGHRMFVFSISNQHEVPFLSAYLSTVLLPDQAAALPPTNQWIPFTSAFYGFTVSHPANWIAQRGTGHWSLAAQTDASVDWFSSLAGRPDFEGYESKIPAGMTATEFINAYQPVSSAGSCYPPESAWTPTMIDGHAATIAYAGCNEPYYMASASVVIGNRVWFFDLHGPDRSFIVQFLSTVKLDPTKVVD